MSLSLATKIPEYFRITPVQKEALKRLGIITIEDLLYHFPVRYGDTAVAKSIDSLEAGDTAVIFGRINNLKASKGFKTKMTMADGTVEDETGRIHCVWFNQPYLAKMITDGSMVRIEGKVSQRRSKNKDEVGALYFSNPKVEVVNHIPFGVGDSLFAPPEGSGDESHTLYPVYPESRGISSSWIYHALQKIFKSELLDMIDDPIPESILMKYHLPSVKTALIWIHTPHNRDDALSARKRFSFEEIFVIQIGKKHARKKYENNPSFLVETSENEVREFVKRFPFQATGAQVRAIESIVGDMKKGQPMSRLLEGDVGSGKTAVAAATAYAVMVSRPKKENAEAIASSTTSNNSSNKYSNEEISDGAKINIDEANSNRDNSIENNSNKNSVRSPIISKKTESSANSTVIGGNKSGLDRSDFKPLLKPSESVVRSGNLQIAYMCPTEILAGQHFESFIQYFSYMPIQIGLITGSGCRKFPSKVNPKGWTDISRTQLLQWVASGEIAVLIGTHALIQKSVVFKNLAYVIIDEQHRFGLAQRAKLVKKGQSQAERMSVSDTTIALADKNSNRSARASLLGTAERGNLNVKAAVPAKGYLKQTFSPPAPHLLSMTATPIPRTLALTMYGDLDLTLLDEIPAGRKPIITELVLPGKRDETYEKIREELKAGRQMFVICPRINEPDPDKEAAIIAKSVKEEAARLKKFIFPEYEIGILHSKMKPDDKDKIMEQFNKGTIQILCATSVVEVGVNVPNATVIIIEGAERFGLAQLHQLRGRVMRSTHQAYCYAFTETSSAKSIERLKALQSAKNGFELAELDLSQRGAGELSGKQQWGVSDIAMEALQNLKMVEAARAEASILIEEDITLSKYPVLKKRVEAHAVSAHFE